MSTVLVTGASGFVGRHAVAALTERGFAVHAVARRPLDDVPATWHEADLFDAAERRSVLEAVQPSHLLHLAWEARHGYFWDAPENLDWVSATLDLVRGFQAVGGVRMVFAGSCAEYDWSGHALAGGPCHERETPRRPATLYGLAKNATHDLIAAYAARTELSYAWARLFFPYGPCETKTRLVPTVVRALIAGQSARIANGSAVRDFLHVHDAGAALAALLDSSTEGPVNVGSGEGVAIADLAGRLARLMGKEGLLEVGEQPPDANNPAQLVADVTRLHDEVGFVPYFDLDAGLADAAAWWQHRTNAGLENSIEGNTT